MIAKSKGKRKKPTTAVPLPSRGPRAEYNPQESHKKKACWSVSLIQPEGRWGWNSITSAELWNQIVVKLKLFERMTWAEILRGRSHFIEVDKLISEAQRMLRELELDDWDKLLCLHLNGTRRIWGIFENGILKVLWYDPDHEICPSNLKHT